MLLCIDIGNSQVVLGLYRKDELIATWRIATSMNKTIDEYMVIVNNLFHMGQIVANKINGVAIASVVPPLTAVFEDVSNQYFGISPLVVGAGIKTGIKIRYDNPREVGADRVANTVAVWQKYGGPACIVDFGTAITFDALSSKGEYLGGAIVPGIEISSQALFLQAARLPRVDFKAPPKAIGSNTVNAIQSGMLFGYASLVEGMVHRFIAELGEDTKVIATGNIAQLIAGQTAVIDFIEPSITLEGLRLIWQMNDKPH